MCGRVTEGARTDPAMTRSRYTNKKPPISPENLWKCPELNASLGSTPGKMALRTLTHEICVFSVSREPIKLLQPPAASNEGDEQEGLR
jgi:hypothetical protein